MKSVKLAIQTTESLALEFFRQCQGEWKSQRRYYTLKKEVEPQEVDSYIKIRFLAQGEPELVKLAQLHNLDEETALICGTEVIWESKYIRQTKKPSTGSTIFGIKENILYRDRGFATSNPVIAQYYFNNPQTISLRTEYDGSVFEEEIKLIGENYRTRQTIISRAGEEIMIGQYLEKRINYKEQG